jgi:hypothetical protein
LVFFVARNQLSSAQRRDVDLDQCAAAHKSENLMSVVKKEKHSVKVVNITGPRVLFARTAHKFSEISVFSQI